MAFSGTAITEARERIADLAEWAGRYSEPKLWKQDDAGIVSVLWHNEFGNGRSFDDEIIKASTHRKEHLFGGQLFAVVPVYVTSICAERCLYCNFRAGNRGVELQRIRLSPEQLETEVCHLVGEKGLRVIELVYATDPLTRIGRMCRDVERVQVLLERHGGGAVGINAEALDEGEYRQLKNAGLNFAVIWQETYDKERYTELHPGSTKKTHFGYRLDAVERMLSAGIEAFGMGVLSGLSDWRMDWALLMEHEAYLKRTYGRSPAILGVPRLKPAAGAVVQGTSTTPSQQEFKAVVALHNVFAASTMPFINTREPWEVCLELATGGGALFTFNCSTVPGGYAAGTRGYQFPTDSFDALKFAPLLEREGLAPIFRWRFEGQYPTLMGERLGAKVEA